MKKILLIGLLLVFTFAKLFADDYYWVGDGGDWTDYTVHWATSSGGSTMHTSIPDINDNVYFDANSFSQDSQVVAIDTSRIECFIMSWSGVPQFTEIIGSTTDTLRIGSEIYLEAANILAFNINGVIIFQPESAGQTLVFDAVDQELSANVFINIPTGTLNLLSDLLLPQKNLYLINGTLDLASNNLSFTHFNAQTDVVNPAVVTSAALKDIDTITCKGSLHFVDQLDVSQFSGVLLFNSQSVDTNYVNFANHTLTSELNFDSSKEYFALSDIITDQDIYLNFSGEFDSQNFDISCKIFDTSSPLMRTIELRTSTIEVTELYVSNTGITLNSSSASLVFNGSSDMYFSSNKTDIQFDAISLISTEILNCAGKLTCVDLSMDPGSKLFMEGGSEIVFTNLTAIGDCGQYIEIRALCDPVLEVDDVCVNATPIFNSGSVNTAQYIKVSNMECQGTVNATNSFDEGGNTGWTISESSVISTLYWIGNTGNWNDTGNWSASSGGPADVCIPSKGTHVVFDNNSFVIGDTVSLFEYGYCASMTWVNIPTGIVFEGDWNLFITDSIVFHNNLTADFNGNIFLENSNPLDTITITSNLTEINAAINIDGSPLWDFVDYAVINNTLEFVQGRLEFSGGSAKIDNFISSNSNSRTLNLTNTILELTGEGVVWDLSSANLTTGTANSELSITNPSAVIKEFNGAGLIYNDLICDASIIKITGDNTLNRLEIAAGNTLIFEEGINVQVDSLDAVASCDLPISFISSEFDNPAVLSKSGWDTLTISNFYLKNIEADTLGGKLFEANQTFRSGNVDGWTFNDTLGGQTFVWLGNTSDWHTLANWEVNSLPATCLPTIKDTVIIDPVIFSAATTHNMTIDRNAYCHSFIASGLTDFLNVELNQNLNVSEAFVLCDNVGITYSVIPDLEELDLYDYGLVIMPDSTSFTLSPFNAAIDVNLYINSSYLTDTIALTTNLTMDTIARIDVMSGCLLAQNKSVQCGFLYSTGSADKILNIEKSDFIVLKNLEFQNTAVLTFESDSSSITFPGNETAYSFFSGNGQTFFDVSFLGNVVDGDNDNLLFISGSNDYHILSMYDGITVFAESGQTQTVDSSLVIMGTCANYVTVRSSVDGSRTYFDSNNAVADTVICVNIIDSEHYAGAVAMLSDDVSNNAGWTFNSTLAADSDFDLPYPACISTNLVFTNQSASMWGGTTNLEFEWMVENDDTTNVVDMNYIFNLQGDYDISLRATDTITGCYEVYVQNLTIEDQSSYITTSIADFEICGGETVTFTASSDLATEFEFYLNNTWVDLGVPTETQYVTDSLNDQDTIRVDAIYNGCIKSSNDLIFTVNSPPVAQLLCSDTDTTICAGDSISFYATSLDTLDYEFFLNGISLGSFSEDSVFTSTTLSDKDTITVRALSHAGCIAWLPNEYIVTVLPNPVVTLTSLPVPPTICDGELMTFNASGASLYSFFVNGTSVTDTSATDFYQSTILENNDIAVCLGIDGNGCVSYSNTVEVTVNPSPSPDFVCNDADLFICIGDEITFTADGADEYLFYVDGIPQGAFSSTNEFVTSSLSHQQTITLDGQIGTCMETSPTSMTINVYPVITLLASTTTICPGENIDFTASGDTIYQFLIDGVPVTGMGANNTYSTTSLADGQQVSVIGTAGACLPEPITITVNPFPAANVACSESDTAICIGDNLTFTAYGAEQYEFFIDGISQGPASVVANYSSTGFTDGQQLTVIATSEYGCVASALDTFNIVVYDYPVVSLGTSVVSAQMCEGEEVIFTAAGADEYQFLIAGNPVGAFSVTDQYATTTLGNAQIVSVNGKSNGCISVAPETFSYTVYSLPNIGLTPITPVSVCEGDEISIEANGAIEYEFFVNTSSQGMPSTTTIFTSTTLSDGDYITATGYQNGCSNPGLDIIYVNVNEIPNLVFTSNIPAEGICYGDTAEFYISGAMEFQFYLDGVEFGEITSESSILIPWLEDGQTIEVIGYNNACAEPSTSPIISDVVYIDAQLIFDPIQPVICNGETVTLNASGGDMYEFYVNDVSQGAASATNSLVLSSLTDGDYVSLVVTDNTSGCTAVDGDYTVNVIGIPNITVDPDIEFCENDSVVLISDFYEDNQWYYEGAEIIGANGQEYVAYQGGDYTVFYINGEQGGVYSCGANSLGQLGTGDNVQSLVSIQTLIDDEIVTVSAGEEFAVGLSSLNNVYAWGDNEWGNIGNGTFSPVYDPVLLESIDNIIKIIAGYNHVIALKSDSTLLAWGKNTNGQLGYGTYASSNFPMPVVSISSVQSIAAGRDHTLALTSDGNVYAWGANDFGQLGTGDNVEYNQPTLIPGINNVIYIAAGADFSMAVCDDGSVWTWGCNENGQLGHNNIVSLNVPTKIYNLQKIVMLAGGNSHAMALNERGEVFTWGANTEGQLGIGSNTQSLTFARVDITGVRSIEAGLYSSFAIKNDGTVWSWGMNNFGQLGDQTLINNNIPVIAEQFYGIVDLGSGNDFVCFVREESKSCSSDIVTLTMDSVPDVTITQNGMTLSTIEGVSYQWYFNSSPISNSNSQTIDIIAQGIYEVEVSFDNGCSEMSDEFTFYLDIEDWYIQQNALVYPNPNDGHFQLILNMPESVLEEVESWTLCTLTGQIIEVNDEFNASDSQNLEFNGIAPGPYYLQIKSSIGIMNIKVFVTQ